MIMFLGIAGDALVFEETSISAAEAELFSGEISLDLQENNNRAKTAKDR